MKVAKVFSASVLWFAAISALVAGGCHPEPAASRSASRGGDIRQLSDAQCVELLTHRNPLARRQAVAELATRGRRVVAPVSKLLTGQVSPAARTAAAEVLAQLGPEAAEAAPALATALADRSWTGREVAAVALGEMGEKARPHIATLCEALQGDPEPQVRLAAARALGKIAARCPPAVGELRPALVRALDDSDPNVRAEAAEALAACQPLPPEAVNKLRTLAESGDFVVRQAAEETLRRIGLP